MEKLVVHGGFTLRGAVNISGSKNASLPILAASLLTDEPVVVRRVPDVSDTNFMVQIMGQLGASVERSSGNVRVEARNLHSEAAYEQVRKMRASICLMGPLMARMQRCVIPLPGGCVIGDRPVDLHIRAIQALGAQVQIERGNLIIEAPRGLKGATVDLSGDHGPTVLGTDNLMMAAVLAEGTTVIESAASEPEVVDLANFLTKMGANIQGAGTRRIVIEGVEKLRGCNHTVIPDRIEAGTFMVAAAMMGDGVTLRRVCEEHMTVVTDLLRKCGHHVEFNERGDTVTIIAGKTPKCGEIKTAPYPGLPHGHAGPDDGSLRHHAGHLRGEGYYFPAAFHALLRTQAHGGGHQGGQRHRRHFRSGNAQRRSRHGLRPAGLRRPGSGSPEGGRHYGNPPPVPY